MLGSVCGRVMHIIGKESPVCMSRKGVVEKSCIDFLPFNTRRQASKQQGRSMDDFLQTR